MTEKDIVKKIKLGIGLCSELPDLEFKTSRTNIPNDIWRTISAFANRRGGGIVVFGVTQNFEVVGCENIDGMQTKLGEYFNKKMSFVLRPDVFVIPYSSKVTILAVYVPECPKDYMPCFFKPVGLPNGAYIREGNSSRKITDNEFRTYVASSKEFLFDLSEASNTSINDLSVKRIRLLLEKSESQKKGELTRKTLKRNF